MRARPLLACALTLLAFGRAEAQAPESFVRRLELRHREGRMDLPGRLREVSGLAVAPDGRLYAHDDERAVVYRIDPREGSVDRGFSVGGGGVRGDFEALAIAGPRFFLITSLGILYEFRAAPEGGDAAARVTDTGLGASCEVEGLAYHAPSESLVVACKTLAPPADEIRVHFLPLDPTRPAPPPLRIPLAVVERLGGPGEVSPSGIDVAPDGDSLLLVAARQEILVEVDFGGRVLALVPLPRGHAQAEGIAFGLDGRLYVADEGDGGDARLTWYGPVGEGRR